MCGTCSILDGNALMGPLSIKVMCVCVCVCACVPSSVLASPPGRRAWDKGCECLDFIIVIAMHRYTGARRIEPRGSRCSPQQRLPAAQHHRDLPHQGPPCGPEVDDGRGERFAGLVLVREVQAEEAALRREAGLSDVSRPRPATHDRCPATRGSSPTWGRPPSYPAQPGGCRRWRAPPCEGWSPPACRASPTGPLGQQKGKALTGNGRRMG